MAVGRAALGAGLALALFSATAGAGDVVTPGVAAGGVPLGTDVVHVLRVLGPPSDELQDPTNPRIYIQRWEERCLGARYTPEGRVLALDAWADLGGACPEAHYTVEGTRGRTVSFASARSDVLAAFGTFPDRVLRAPRFVVLVYDKVGVAFYIRLGGVRDGRVDAFTVFPLHTSRDVWAPSSWGGQ